jgi:hypothetical protein
MSAGFAAVEIFAFCSCMPCGTEAAIGAGCALCACAARAEDRCGLRRTAAAAQRRHETAAIVRTDERRKKVLQDLDRDATRRRLDRLVTDGHPPLDRRWAAWMLKHGGHGGNTGGGRIRLRLTGRGFLDLVLPFPTCAKYFRSFLLTFHWQVF